MRALAGLMCVAGISASALGVDLGISSGRVLGSTTLNYATVAQPQNLQGQDIDSANVPLAPDGGSGQTGGGYGQGTVVHSCSPAQPVIAHSCISINASIQNPNADEVRLVFHATGLAVFDDPSGYVGRIQSGLQLHGGNGSEIEVEITGSGTYQYQITQQGNPFGSVSFTPAQSGGGTIAGNTLTPGRYLLDGQCAVEATHIVGEQSQTFDGTLTLRIFSCPEPNASWGRAFSHEPPPPPRRFATIVPNPISGKSILFGGFSDTYADPGSGVWLNDTWDWDGFRWTQLSPAQSPSPRYSPAGAFDSLSRRVVVVGGMGIGYQPIRDVWVWSGAWNQQDTALTPSGARYGHGIAWDSARGRMVLFGGDANGNPNDAIYANDTWEWTGVMSQAWTLRTPPASPPPRKDHVMVFDSNIGKVLLFGGYADDGFALPGGQINPRTFKDVWAWDGTGWTHLPDPPEGMKSRSLAHAFYDPVRRRTVVFGGLHRSPTGFVELDDTWEFDGASWTLANEPSAFGARHGGAAAFDSARGVGILFGGSRCGRGDTWIWRSSVVLPDRPGEDDSSARVLTPGSTLVLNAPSSLPGISSYRWFLNGAPLSSGGRVTGAESTQLRISALQPSDEGTYSVRIIQTCIELNGPPIRVEMLPCPADVDDGSRTGRRDGAVTIDDLLAFLSSYEQGCLGADLDDDGDPAGSNPDAAVTIVDLLFFLERFARGC